MPTPLKREKKDDSHKLTTHIVNGKTFVLKHYEQKKRTDHITTTDNDLR